MNTVHLIPGRRWLGWYNSPGSYFVAKKYGMLPDSTIWDGLFPGPSVTPTNLVELDTKAGLRYTGVHSGTQLDNSGHLSYLIARYCENKVKTRDITSGAAYRNGEASGKTSDPSLSPPNSTSESKTVNNLSPPEEHKDIFVTVVDLADVDENSDWGSNSKISRSYFKPIPTFGMVGIIATILFSFAASVLAALYNDWFSFSMILYGALANGMTQLVLGKGELYLDLRKPPKESPPGDGFLWDSKKIILVQGTERIVSTILLSEFRLEYSKDPKYRKIGYCSILLFTQFLFQLFLIPQGILVGQILFISTLAMSWICNGYLASFDYEELQTELLFRLIGRKPVFYKFSFAKWSAAVAFTMAYFDFKDTEPRGILDELVPNNTPSWNLWKDCICAVIKLKKYSPSSLIKDLPLDNGSDDELRVSLKGQFDKLGRDKDRIFVKTFLEQADQAFNSVNAVKEGLRKGIEEINYQTQLAIPQQLEITEGGASSMCNDTKPFTFYKEIV